MLPTRWLPRTLLCGLFLAGASEIGCKSKTATQPTTAAAESEKSAHTREVEQWRSGRLERLTSDTGWLVVSGLFWLKEGDNPFGSAETNPIVLPDHSAPAHAGTLRVKGNEVTLVAKPGVDLRVGDKPVETAVLASDEPGPPDIVTLGDLRFFLIIRGEKPAIRLRDLQSPRRTNFEGIEHFPIDSKYRVRARFVENPPGTTIKIGNVLGTQDDMLNPGRIVFELLGASLEMDAVLNSPDADSFFVIFKDATAAKSTYGAGRFVYTEGLVKDGHVTLDFNKAYTPPCGFTPYSTCPLPPPRNRLKITIEAGEKYGPHK